MKKAGIIYSLFFVFCISVFISGNLNAREHPFLICKRTQFDELRARAEKEPWKSMKQEALETCANKYNWRVLDFTDSRSNISKNRKLLQKYLGASALAYILDTNNSAQHVENTRQAIVNGLAAVEFAPSKRWYGTVPPMAIAFTSILALDIIYNDLTAGQIAECEKVIETQINKINREGHWDAARYGTHGTWDIYKGQRKEPDDAFYKNYLGQMTEDGVSTSSTIYAFARLGSGDPRLQKTGYADVLEFTEIDNRYYNNSTLEEFYRWLFSCSVTPAKEFHFFGDLSPTWEIPHGILFWRVGRFDKKASAYAAWLMEDQTPPGHFLSYILMDEPLPDPLVPESKLYMKGMACFREKEDSPESLGAMLYNITGNPDWHAHQEVNAISCAAYGVRLLVNGGWLGAGMRPPAKNNTISINGNQHQQKTGGGLEEGITGSKFDYATGNSGKALGNDHFKRSLVMVHQQDGIGGYFIVLDDVNADKGDIINSHLQIATESAIKTVVPKQEYIADIDHHARIPGVNAQVFFASGPNKVDTSFIESGYLKRDPEAGKHYRLRSNYTTNNTGNSQILTVLFPFDKLHPEATIQKMANRSFSGARLKPGKNTVDYIYASEGKVKNKNNNITFCAKLAMCRHLRSENSFYFCRSGIFFRDDSFGFQSDKPVSLYMKGKKGCFTGKSTSLTLFYPEINGIIANGSKLKVLDKGNGWVKVDMPAGRHELKVF